MISIIVGMTKSRLIGKGNELPWHIPEDLQNFKDVTRGASVIMGLMTFKSIGKPLPGRNNIVLNFDRIEIPGVDVCTSIPEAIERAKGHGGEIFCIGGKSIYKQFLDIADRLYISWMRKEYEGDVYFPDFDLNNWEVAERKDFEDFEFVTYNKKR